MTRVIDAIATVLERHAVSDCRVCVGLSGGLDSVVLLTAMCELAKSRKLLLSAVHVNHGLSSHAREWSGFCADLCGRLGVPLTMEAVSVDLGAGLGTEAAARAARYAVFSKLDTDYLALAHHIDDQIETFLIQLLRGAGVPGLSAMPVERALGTDGPRLLRPLLTLSRMDLDEFARRHALKWVEDESNSDLSLDRNFLRHSLLPVLEQRFPAYRSTLWRATQNLADAARLVDILGHQDLMTLRNRDGDGNGDGLRLDVLGNWPRSRALNALRCLFRVEGYTAPHRAPLEEALRQAFEAREEACVRVDFDDISLRRYRECIYLVENLEVPPDWRALWCGEDSVALPRGLGALRFRQARGTGLSDQVLRRAEVSVCFRGGGERMALALDRPHRGLRKLYQEAGVAPWVRERTPMVFCGNDVIYVPGVGLAAEFQAKPDEASIEIDWVCD